MDRITSTAVKERCRWASSIFHVRSKHGDLWPAEGGIDAKTLEPPRKGPRYNLFQLKTQQPTRLSPYTGPAAVSSRRFFGVGGSYGYGAFFRGEADAAAQSNVRRQRLKDEETHYTGPMTLKMPEMVAALVAEGALRSPLKRPGVYVYHHHVPQSPQKSLVYFSATTQQAGAPAAAAATSMLQQRERGVAAQLILDGRGVKAYFDPEWPDLMVRLGVGVKPLALRRLAEQYATRARIFIDKRGLLLTIHGWDKRAVGTLTMELYRHLKANPYTGKGARIAFYPVNRKVSTKK
ncbi:uncharacterized protein LOC34618570 [Cyclospora cayetanensis]|uniref:Uncharacterized protein LOC34618570 n=1 Tax=Cyclospora cayetanensis TaxID=88456 RepID=A0A6P6RT82_9EIME|nr:uncharacterized protein LOC34618570 [Cyclospora cayetanensis]